jgi:peptidoglycan/xylan/chitin deacetylase (PgdA/CDA1 family)
MIKPVKGEIRTLCYHRVSPSAMRSLARQISYLKNYGEFITADQALELTAGGSFEGRYFLITFDDGYDSTLYNALPVLADQNTPAIMFVISSYLADPPKDSPDRYLDSSECARWVQAGMDIGSHSHTHRQLSRLSDAEVREEFARSRDILTALAGKPVRHFACPWGVPGKDFVVGQTEKLAWEAGYASFFTTTRGPAGAGANPLNLPRDVVEPEWGCWQLRYFFGN